MRVVEEYILRTYVKRYLKRREITYKMIHDCSKKKHFPPISIAHISEMLANKTNVSVETLIKFCECTDLSLNEVIKGKWSEQLQAEYSADNKKYDDLLEKYDDVKVDVSFLNAKLKIANETILKLKQEAKK